jgi:curved DNA-binding protein CbpA
MSLIDDFQLLDIPTNANEQEAKAAFRRLARRYHPDKNPDTDTTELFQRLQAAYENVHNAIRQGTKVDDWKPFTFGSGSSSSAKNRYSSFSNTTDKEQEAFIKERQRAYEEMKRNNAPQEKAREDAFKSARNMLNEKRLKALYEEAFKASNSFSSEGYNSKSNTYTSSGNTQQTKFDIPPYQSFIDDEEEPFYTSPEREPISQPIRLDAAKAAFRAATYIACFAAGIYSTLYWQSSQKEAFPDTQTITYISGLYPQFRVGINHTLTNVNLYAEPDSSSSVLLSVPNQSNLQSIKMQGDWLTVRYQGVSGWVEAKNIGYGSVENARSTNCIGQPGAAPLHGERIGEAEGSSRLRILNQLPQHSLLTFESYDGQKPFSIYLYGKQSYAANYIPRGSYRLVLETGSLYHHACNQFLFNDTTKVILDQVDFASTEQSLTLKP